MVEARILMSYHRILETMYSKKSLRKKVGDVHDIIKEQYSFVARLAIAVFDDKTEILKTFLFSGDDSPLFNYKTSLDNALSLKKIKEEREPRVINDIDVLLELQEMNEHTSKIVSAGYKASYTIPIFYNDTFYGFIFFNSYEKDVFVPDVLSYLDLSGQLVAMMVVLEIQVARVLMGAVSSATHITNLRDSETGNHLYRMARYARLIASELADVYRLDDEYIEHVFLFAPMHDIGKIAIPDNILLKPGPHNEEEWDIMKTHSVKGREIIDKMISEFKLDSLQHVDVLKNIAEFHHESMNGSGYPAGLAGNEIPLEAKIVAVADVFDALTTKRVYKEAYSIEESVKILRQMAGSKLDSECVEALVGNLDEVRRIQDFFGED